MAKQSDPRQPERPNASTLPPSPQEREVVLGSSLDGKEAVVLQGRLFAFHRLVLGLSGMGKSKLLASLCPQLLNQRIGFVLLDPHGDLCDDNLAVLADSGFYADARAYQRLLYLDFTGPGNRWIPFNVLSQPYELHHTAANVLEATKRAWPTMADGSAPALENLVLFGSYVLAANELPLTQLPRLLSDALYRHHLLEGVSDRGVREFFARFDVTGKRSDLLSESTMRKVSLLTFTPALKFSLGQATNLLRMRELMDRGISVICNLGGLDAQSQRLLGCLIAISVEEAALSRADVPEEVRRPYHFIVDEFSQFAARSAESMNRVLALTRKYGLSLTMATQTLGQIPADLRSALQNTTLISYRLGVEDAHWAAGELTTVDPSRVKLSPRGSPSYMSAAEQRGEIERLIATLPVRQALLRSDSELIAFESLTIPPISAKTRREVERIKARYAELLLTPQEAIERTEQSERFAAHQPLGASRTVIPFPQVTVPHPSQAPQPTAEKPVQPQRSRRSIFRRVQRRVPLDDK